MAQKCRYLQGSWMFPISERLVCKKKKKKNAPLSIYSLGFSPIVPMENGRFAKPGLGQTHTTKHTYQQNVGGFSGESGWERQHYVGARRLSGGSRQRIWRRVARAGAKNGTSFFGVLSLCLSRACLGKMIVFMYKWHLKNAVFRRGFSRSWTPDANGFTMRCENKQAPFFGVLLSHA